MQTSIPFFAELLLIASVGVIFEATLMLVEYSGQRKLRNRPVHTGLSGERIDFLFGQSFANHDRARAFQAKYLRVDKWRRYATLSLGGLYVLSAGISLLAGNKSAPATAFAGMLDPVSGLHASFVVFVAVVTVVSTEAYRVCAIVFDNRARRIESQMSDHEWAGAVTRAVQTAEAN